MRLMSHSLEEEWERERLMRGMMERGGNRLWELSIAAVVVLVALLEFSEVVCSRSS